ncbi:tyrosine-protein phosphatase [Streptomyces sp. NPDC059875]|uniref:tyrosine-protein phosphatase n=1 Tax=unclassified Streptomyces TaxID=2593676 RepID=UPI0036656ECC
MPFCPSSTAVHRKFRPGLNHPPMALCAVVGICSAATPPRPRTPRSSTASPTRTGTASSVEEEYGSFRSYLKQGLGIDARELKELKRDLLVG